MHNEVHFIFTHSEQINVKHWHCTVVVLCNGCFFVLIAQSAMGTVELQTSYDMLFVDAHSSLARGSILSFEHLFTKWQPGQRHSPSIYMLGTCLRGTSEDDSLMSSVTANLAVWE